MSNNQNPGPDDYRAQAPTDGQNPYPGQGVYSTPPNWSNPNMWPPKSQDPQPSKKPGHKVRNSIFAALLFMGGCTVGTAIGSDSQPAAGEAPTVTATATATATTTQTITASGKPAPASTVTVTAAAPAPAETSKEAEQVAKTGSNAPSQEWPDGTYEIGTGKDIAPGTYKAIDVAEYGCYVEQSKDASGDFGSLITNDIITGPGYVTVLAKANYLTVQGCTLVKK